MRKWLLIIMMFCMMQGAYALQIKSVIDNETTSVKVSSSDVTRIFVEGDRIKSVKGLKGAYTRENDEKNGEIYIQPSALFQNRSFTMLINTEQGRHFTLLFHPTASPSESLMLVPKGVGRLRAARFETVSSYDSTLIHLIRHMKNGTLPEGYAVHQVGDTTVYQGGNRYRLTLRTVYEGLRLKGEVFTIKNELKTPIMLDERTFYKPGARAISLDRLAVPAKEMIHLYRVMNND
jgi:conjugal transfer pilus assembly protein TraK